MSKFFIFDIDGTLVDSNDFHALAWQQAFLEKGKEVSLKEIRAQIGKGADQLLPMFLNKEELKKFSKELSEIQVAIFKQKYFIQVRPFAKVRELFKAIRGEGGAIALASSSDKKNVEQYEILAEISDLVEKSASADDAEKTKPAPDIF